MSHRTGHHVSPEWDMWPISLGCPGVFWRSAALSPDRRDQMLIPPVVEAALSRTEVRVELLLISAHHSQSAVLGPLLLICVSGQDPRERHSVIAVLPGCMAVIRFTTQILAAGSSATQPVLSCAAQ